MSYNSLKDLNKELKIKKAILNIKNLETIKDFGCRILIMFSSMFDENGDLYIERDQFGEAKKISLMEFYTILKPKEEDAKLNVDVVFVNVINGDKIAHVFKKLGVA